MQWNLVGLLALGSIPSSLVTVFLLHTIFGDAEEYAALLSFSLGLMLIVTSVVLFSKHGISSTRLYGFKNIKLWLSRYPTSITFLMGVALGALVTLSSIGAGAFCAAILLLLYPQLLAARVVGTDIAHAVPLTMIAGMGHWLLLGNVDLPQLGALLLGSLPAVWFGTHFGSKLPNNSLQHILSSILLLLGIKFVFY